ncbi:hypothetical protein [Brevibacillus fulvus]|uniref:Uncharacterized protein n=1 Tax=Brevibacillus fulvus TaxID=1125967 RepID=A0A938Y083_9BACL|nr:hypothetical protein [Brevibacillus fulvus]MBM7590981.1 hypothetical protein [Brevibacillus fulvus]
MWEPLLEKLDQHLSQHGVITNLILRTERSLFEEEETREMELYFAAMADNEAGQPYATLHLFPVADTMVEIEVELAFTIADAGKAEIAALWNKAREIVAEIAWTEKNRYLAPDQLVERTVVFDYHFVVDVSETAQRELEPLFARFAQDLAKLLQLG